MSEARQIERRGRRRTPGRREAVLRVSARVFSELGFRQATLDDIAKELKVTRPALYHYADSKEKLLSECGEIARGKLMRAVKMAQRAAPGLEQLRVFFESYAEIVCEDFGRCFVLTALSEMSPGEREVTRLAQLELARSVTAMVRTGIRDGSIRNCNPADVSRALYGAFNNIPKWINPQQARSPSTIAKVFLDLIVEGLRPRVESIRGQRKANQGQSAAGRGL